MSKKKSILKEAKKILSKKREENLAALSKMYRLKKEDGADTNLIEEEINRLIEEIRLIDEDLSRKDKKSSRIEWLDTDYSASVKSKRKKKITDTEEYEKVVDKKISMNNGPVALWLQPGILVKKRDSEMLGIVLSVRSHYSSVLFGDREQNVRSLSLRPADWI